MKMVEERETGTKMRTEVMTMVLLTPVDADPLVACCCSRFLAHPYVDTLSPGADDSWHSHDAHMYSCFQRREVTFCHHALFKT